jgi:bifunctional DNA-binding transcriptional regulator/antitoxin component of YhaV-PrlF toxin-antitoxin module
MENNKIKIISIPKEIREQANFNIKETLELDIANEKIMLMKLKGNSFKATTTIDEIGRIFLSNLSKLIKDNIGNDIKFKVEHIISISKSLNENKEEISKIDLLGKVMLPNKIREKAGFDINEALELEIKNGEIAIMKAEEKDSFKVKRSIEESGMITIPIEFRRFLGYQTGDILKFETEHKLVIST